MTTNNEAFEKFLAELDFQDIAHDTESIKNLYRRAWQAATTEANKRMVELQASNNHLREVFGKVKVINDKYVKNGHIDHIVENAIYSTPAESLQAYKNEVLERSAKEIDAMVATYVESGNKYHEVSEGRKRCVNKARAAMSCAETIRALKEVK